MPRKLPHIKIVTVDSSGCLEEGIEAWRQVVEILMRGAARKEQREAKEKEKSAMNKIATLLRQAVETDVVPAELSECSPMFMAVLGYLTRIATTHPVITDLTVTTDGALLAKHEGDFGFDHSLGISRADLITNLNGLCDSLEMNEEEKKELLGAVPTT